MKSPLRKALTVRPFRDEATIPDLYQRFSECIDLAASLSWAWPQRGYAACEKAIQTLRAFLQGKAGTPDVKAHFANLSLLGGTEVLMTEQESYAVYCLVEVCHAAAHLGHLVVADSRKGESNGVFAAYQKAYVVYGMDTAQRFHDQVELMEDQGTGKGKGIGLAALKKAAA